MELRQVLDLLLMRLPVTEHQLMARCCPCKHDLRHRAGRGDGAGAIHAADHRDVLYLYLGGVLVEEAHRPGAGRILRDPVSAGTVPRMTARAADGLQQYLIQVGDRIVEAEVAGFDETELRVAGTLHWCAAPAPASTP